LFDVVVGRDVNIMHADGCKTLEAGTRDGGIHEGRRDV
jgi:hypothetical protein